MERYLAMKYSLRYEAIVTRFHLTVAIASCWLITKVYFVTRLRIIPGVKVITATSKIWNSYFASDYFLSCFRLFCLSSAYDPDQIGTSFQRGHNKVSGGKKSLENNHYYYWWCHIVLFQSASILGFIIFPYSVIAQKILDSLLPFALSFFMLNSLLNPIIYCWRSTEIRETMIHLLKKQDD